MSKNNTLQIGKHEMKQSTFLNTVRQESGLLSLPIADSGLENFPQIGHAILNLPKELQNTWHETAMNLVAKILFNTNLNVSPLSEFIG